MPFFEGVTGAVHYRSWTTAHPRLILVFLHGLGQNSGHYHRFARVMNTEGLDVWALDHVGHGLTEGELSDASQIDGLADNAMQLADIARAEREGVPIALMGHSLGAATVIAALTKNPDGFCAAVLCGTPKSTTGKTTDLADTEIPCWPSTAWTTEWHRSTRCGRGSRVYPVRSYANSTMRVTISCTRRCTERSRWKQRSSCSTTPEYSALSTSPARSHAKKQGPCDAHGPCFALCEVGQL